MPRPWRSLFKPTIILSCYSIKGEAVSLYRKFFFCKPYPLNKKYSINFVLGNYSQIAPARPRLSGLLLSWKMVWRTFGVFVFLCPRVAYSFCHLWGSNTCAGKSMNPPSRFVEHQCLFTRSSKSVYLKALFHQNFQVDTP